MSAEHDSFPLSNLSHCTLNFATFFLFHNFSHIFQGITADGQSATDKVLVGNDRHEEGVAALGGEAQARVC